MPGVIMHRLRNYPKPYEEPVSSTSGMEKPPPTSAVLQEAPLPLYEEIDDAFKTASQPSVPLKYGYDDTRQLRRVQPPATPGYPEYQVLSPPRMEAPTYEATSHLCKDIKFTDSPTERVNPDVKHRPFVHHTLDNPHEVHPSPSGAPPDTPPQYEQYNFTPASQQQTSAVKHDNHSLYYQGLVHEGYRQKAAEIPIPPARRHSYSIQPPQEPLDSWTYTPMDGVLSHQRLSSSPRTHSRTASTSSSSDINFQFSLEDLTKEQLLTYIQIIQSSQPASDTNLASSAQNERSNLYVNIMTDDFQNATDDVPPPLPPKPGRKPSAQDTRPVLPPKKSGIPKRSQSFHLPGASAEAVRQRYQFRQRDYDGHVHFQLAEEDDDEFPQHADEAMCGREGHPPEPQRLHRLSDTNNDHMFTLGRGLEQPRQNIPQRSRTMMADLSIANRYRKRYKGSQDINIRDQSYGQNFEIPASRNVHRQRWDVASYKEEEETRHAQQPSMQDVQSMLGKS